MQRDSLEKFITANRASFDDATPDLKVWSEIDRRLQTKSAPRIVRWRALRMAAAVAALLLIGAAAGLYLSAALAGKPRLPPWKQSLPNTAKWCGITRARSTGASNK